MSFSERIFDYAKVVSFHKFSVCVRTFGVCSRGSGVGKGLNLK